MFISNAWRILTNNCFVMYDEGIKGSKKDITMKILGQISNLPMGLQSTLSLTMILKPKMIQADLNVVGKVKII